MNKLILALLLVLGGSVFGSEMSHFTMWRGETRYAIAHDALEAGLAPEGITVRTGVAGEVRYRTGCQNTHYETFADRVEWGSQESGLRVVEVKVDESVKPGEYQFGDIEVTVLDRTLPKPKDWKFHLDLWQHPWAVSRYFNLKPFSSAHYGAMKPLWELLADAGQKTLTVTLLDRPWNHQCYDAYGTMVRHIKTKDGKWKFDYSLLDEYVEFGRKCGLGPEIACYTMCPWGYMVTWEDEDGKESKVKAVPGTPEFEEYWGEFLVDFAAHMKAKGWFEDTYICMDERSPEDVMNIVKFVNAKAPGMKTFLAGNRRPSEFKGITLDNVSFSLSRIDDSFTEEAKARRAEGKITTCYICCGPLHPNTMCHNDIHEAFFCTAFTGIWEVDGLLRWAWNSWTKDPMRDASFFTSFAPGWGSGDTYLVYPNGAPSLRFLYMRNGIVAAEKMRILREEGGEAAKAIAELKGQYNRNNALENKTAFYWVMMNTQKAVNPLK